MAVIVSPRQVKVVFAVGVSCSGSELETWRFELWAEGNNCSLPGTTLAVRTSQITAKNLDFWLRFGDWLRDYRRKVFGSDSLVGLVEASNNEKTPIPSHFFEMSVGMVKSAFDLM